MGQVDITVNGKSYRIACEDGQESRIEALARTVDDRVAELVAQVGQIGDTRLLVMASLLIADELADLKDASAGGEETRVAEAVEALAGRIERLAERLSAS